jgi:hypothetical protein
MTHADAAAVSPDAAPHDGGVSTRTDVVSPDAAAHDGGVSMRTDADVVSPDATVATRVCAESYTVRTNAELEALAGCSVIEQGLDIRGEVTTLLPLASLTRVGGALEIRNLPSLVSLRGLERLSAVGGHFELRQNDVLSLLQGLEGLSTVGGYFELRQNNALTSANGLAALRSVSGYFEIVLNPRLTTVAGMTALRSVGRLEITSNPMLPQCQATQLAAQVGVVCSCSGNLMSGPCS